MARVHMIQFRRGTAAEWAAANPVLAPGEPGLETDTGRFKVGNGIATWSALAVVNALGSLDQPQTGHIENIDRLDLASPASTASTGTSGDVRLSYFTAKAAQAVTQMQMYSGTTAAGATPTVVRWGVYSEAANGDLTRVATIANDTTLLAAASTGYLRALEAGLTFQPGQRYAVAQIVVSAAAMPTMTGKVSLTATLSEWAQVPRVSGVMAGQTDLPASIANASISASSAYYYVDFS